MQQKKAIRIINKKPYRHHTEPLLVKGAVTLYRSRLTTLLRMEIDHSHGAVTP